MLACSGMSGRYVLFKKQYIALTAALANNHIRLYFEKSLAPATLDLELLVPTKKRVHH